MSTKADFLSAMGATTTVGAAGTFNAATAIATAGAITSASHGATTGFGPIQLTTGGTLPTGLAASTDYFVYKLDNDTLQLASSVANAIAGTVIPITAVGSGTVTMARGAFSKSFADTDVDATANTATITGHGVATGFGPIQLTTAGTLPGGLSALTNYWLKVVDANTVKFSTSQANALANTTVDITNTGSGAFVATAGAFSKTFNAATGITLSDGLTLTAHGRSTGFGPVRLTTNGSLPAGLSTATNYWIIRVDDNTVLFATSKANALAGTAVDITGPGSGTTTMSPTMQTLAEAMEDCLNEVLTAPGNRVTDAADNTSKAWAYLCRANFA